MGNSKYTVFFFSFLLHVHNGTHYKYSYLRDTIQYTACIKKNKRFRARTQSMDTAVSSRRLSFLNLNISSFKLRDFSNGYENTNCVREDRRNMLISNSKLYKKNSFSSKETCDATYLSHLFRIRIKTIRVMTQEFITHSRNSRDYL